MSRLDDVLAVALVVCSAIVLALLLWIFAQLTRRIQRLEAQERKKP